MTMDRAARAYPRFLPSLGELQEIGEVCLKSHRSHQDTLVAADRRLPGVVAEQHGPRLDADHEAEKLARQWEAESDALSRAESDALSRAESDALSRERARRVNELLDKVGG